MHSAQKRSMLICCQDTPQCDGSAGQRAVSAFSRASLWHRHPFRRSALCLIPVSPILAHCNTSGDNAAGETLAQEHLEKRERE